MAALVAIMIMVSISTFSWSSLRDMVRQPKLSTLIMLVTVVVVVLTHDLAAGVLAGVLLSGVFFAWRAAALLTISTHRDGLTEIYTVAGQVFFASADGLYEAVDYLTDADTVILDLTHARFWDVTSVQILEKTLEKLRNHGRTVEVVGLKQDQHSIIASQSDNALLAM